LEEETDMISFCCPSRGRPELAKRLIDTATETQKYDTEFLFYLNDDDKKLEEYKDLLNEKHYTVGPNQSTCYSWNLMCEKASHDIVMLMGDDVKVHTHNWDKKIIHEFNKYEDKILMVVPNDGRSNKLARTRALNQERYFNSDIPILIDDEPFGAPHFALHKNWINTVGYLAPPLFWHWFVDTWTQTVARKLNRCLFLPGVEFKAKKITDDTGRAVRENLNIQGRDNYVWSKVNDRHLNADVTALRNVLKN
jgi:hypothetical protein|tara:strand:- start:1190 stop:1942 length:753 start_codon:yes stop_codon:yes gene_type:complete